MSSKGKGSGKRVSKKAHYTSYKASSKEEKNRAAKLARHLKKHPNDNQTAESVGKKPVHRKKPTGKKAFVKPLGTQEIGEGVYSYITDMECRPGHPVLALTSQGYPFERARKLKNCAILSEEFKLEYSHYVG